MLWWAFRGADLAVIAHQISAAKPAWLVLAGSLSTTGGLIRAVRWRLLLEPVGPPTSFRARWAALNIGFMVTNLFPARLGEVARPLALSRMAPVSAAAALGTVVLERVLDAFALLALLLVTLLSPAFPLGAMVFGRRIGDTVFAVVLGAMVVLALVVFAVFRPERIVRGVEILAARLPERAGKRVAGSVEPFLSGLRLVRHPATLLRALAWSLVLWLWMASAFWAAFRAFDIDLGMTAAMFTECVLSLVLALPAGPGFIGTMQAGVMLSLHDVFGVPAASTLALSVAYHIAGFIPVTALGLYYAWRLGLRVASLRREAAGGMKRFS